MTEALTVGVVPSTWLARTAGRKHVRTEEPYDRVVLVKPPKGGELLASPTHLKDPDAAYSETDIRLIDIPSNSLLTSRFTAFFGGFICYASGEIFDCHFFANWMAGKGRPNTSSEYEGEADSIIRNGTVVDGGFRLGEQVVIGGVKGNGPKPYHSFMGLGEDRDDCLQVMSTGGHVGITKIESMHRFYAEAYAETVSDFGMYVLRAAEVAQPETATNHEMF